MTNQQKTNALIAAQGAAGHANEAATRALAFMIADSVTDGIFAPSIKIQLDNLKLNAQLLMDAIKSIEEMEC